MGSTEVAAAVGKAPERPATPPAGDTAARLAATRDELAAAEREGEQAAARFDTDAVVQARARAAVLARFVEQLEVAAAEEAQAALLDAARQRVEAIAREHAGLTRQLEKHEPKLQAAAAAYARVAGEVNGAWRALDVLRLEAEALADRFGIAAAALPRVTAPDGRPEVVAAVRVARGQTFAMAGATLPATERDPSGLDRRRRTFAEIAGSPGYALIEQAGLRPWPPLNEQQRRALARGTDHSEADAALLASEADHLPVRAGRFGSL